MMHAIEAAGAVAALLNLALQGAANIMIVICGLIYIRQAAREAADRRALRLAQNMAAQAMAPRGWNPPGSH
jgi:hypothetical protein